MIRIDLTGLEGFLSAAELTAAVDAARSVAETLPQMEMSGWLTLPTDILPELPRIAAAGARIAEQSDALVVVGVGGSSLGARTLVDALPTRSGVREVFYTGDHLSGGAMVRLLDALQTREFSVVVTSKSGTTMEPMAALRFMLKLLRERYGDAMRERLYVVAGEQKSALRDYAETLGCEHFTIPDTVGGRYSVFTAGGLLPAAARGLNIVALVRGATMQAATGLDESLAYAATRQLLHKSGFATELLASFEPELRSFGEWWKQLFGESEGKQQRGIFPATVSYSADLHSMGQYVQEGRRDLFETLLSFERLPEEAAIPPNAEFDDGLAFLDEVPLNLVNTIALQSVRAAHVAGGVPVIELIAGGLNELSLGALLYFFEVSCAVSALIDGVNPFNQPGVEAYKTIMRTKLEEV